MKLDVLYNFISPVTGRVLSDPDYVLVGNRNGVAIPSPALIDMRLDIIDMKHDFDSLAASSFIVGFPNTQLPNSQVLSSLNDGFMFNTGGIISTANLPLTNLTYNNIWIGDVNNLPVANPTILQSNLPNLTKNNIWIGDLNNRPQPNQTITIDNLPNLGVASITVPNPLDPTTPITISGGKIWHGTDSNRPEESTALLIVEGDIALINFRFLSANFIMGSGNLALKGLMPFSQFLDGLPAGILKQDVPGKIAQAVPGVDYVDVVNPTQRAISVWDEPHPNPTPKMLINTGITVDEENRMSGIDTVNTKFVIASDQITTNTSVFALTNVGTRKIQIYDQWNGPGRLTKSVNFIGPDHILNDVNFVVPSATGTTGQVLTDIGNDLANNRILSFKNILPDNLQNGLLAQGTDANNPIFVNATLTQGKMWVGDAQNKPVETDLNFAPNDATYILKTANANLNQAQALDILGIGMAKIVAGGAFAIAIPDEDYATKATLEQIKAETETFKNEAAASAEEAAASATEAAASATEASASAVEATGAAATATTAAGAAGASATAAGLSATGAGVSALAAAASAISAGSSSSSASSSASDASSSANNAAGSATNSASSATQAHDYLNTLLTTGITLQGDITGSGNLSNPITTYFKENPTFLGHEYIKIPTGNTAQRPSNSSVGMVRYNTDL